MPKQASILLSTDVKQQYTSSAQINISDYVKLSKISRFDRADADKTIKSVIEKFKRHIRYENQKYVAQTINNFTNSLSKGFELHLVELRLAELLFCIVEKATEIKAPRLSYPVQIKQDIPLVQPDDIILSALQRRLYNFIEAPETLSTYMKSTYDHVGILITWLMLKEGVSQPQNVRSLLNREVDIFYIGTECFFDTEHQRFWLSETAVMMLKLNWNVRQRSPANIVNAINRTLHKLKVTPSEYKISAIMIRSMLRTELALSLSTVESAIRLRIFPTTPLKKYTLFRLLKGSAVEIPQNAIVDRTIPQRQSKAWSDAMLPNKHKRRYAKTIVPVEQTTAEQYAEVTSFISRLKEKTTQKKSGEITTPLKNELRSWLEKTENAIQKPLIWLILAWAYHLLDEGGKKKDRLRLKTIYDYVDYVAKPFIQEFSGCNMQVISSDTWVAKLNDVVNEITSSKKQFVLYFADFLITKNLVKEMDISDIDVPCTRSGVNANIITQHEADRICQLCDLVNTPLSTLAKLYFCFGFYSGLRRNEISGLQFSDFKIGGPHYVSLQVRPNRFRDLKSAKSSRNLPLDCLWPEQRLKELIDYLDGQRAPHVNLKTKVVADINKANQAFNLLSYILRSVTGDQNLVFHHCRHSFCNWMMLLLNIEYLEKFRTYHLCDHPYFDDVNYKKVASRLALTPWSRKRLWAVSSLLGHTTPEVTLSSYYHLSEFVHHLALSDNKLSKSSLREFWALQDENSKSSGKLLNPAHNIDFLRPKQMTVCGPKTIHSDNQTLLKQINNAFSMTSDKELSLLDVWEVMSMLATNKSHMHIKQAIEVDDGQINQIIKIDEELSSRPGKKARRNLPRYANAAMLKKSEIASVETLLTTFNDRCGATEDGNHALWSGVHDLMRNRVASKDSLIRTHNVEAIRSLLNLFKELNTEDWQLSFTWYFPSEKQFDKDLISQYRKDLKFWLDEIESRFDNEVVTKIVIPHRFVDYLRTNEQSKVKVTISDEGRFLSYLQKGTVSLHFLKPKADSNSTPRRNKAFISFLCVLAVFGKLFSLNV
jgi:integrase